ncbi:unnamed protein product [Caretta caretta]
MLLTNSILLGRGEAESDNRSRQRDRGRRSDSKWLLRSRDPTFTGLSVILMMSHLRSETNSKHQPRLAYPLVSAFLILPSLSEKPSMTSPWKRELLSGRKTSKKSKQLREKQSKRLRKQ